MDLTPSDVVGGPDAAADAADDVDASGDPPDSESASTSTSTPTPDSSPSRTDRLKEMLFSTSPEKDLDDVDAPYDPERGGLNRVYRGLQKMVDVDGLPAIADVVIGVAEWLDLADPMDQDGSSDSDDSQNSESAESESDRPADLQAALEEVKS
ncbi:hypothetical protein [Haloarcula salina]|uniref:Uncharacterized protein n=1 Tax=Haloarcula salina TaxID=1429914 RepID=A0AA41GBZ6_9EURY|nr:hypothetical protein [Haloarcula salina]MBV0903922.1 hypothetical protein [Haloarcula salina]